MANIVVIEEDTRLRAQLETLLTELNADHKVRFFSSSTEFERLYFGEAPITESLREIQPFSDLTESQFQWFEGQNLSDRPFSLGSPQSARPLKDLIQILSPGIAEPFRQGWQKFLESRESPNQARCLAGLASPKGQVWAVEFFFEFQKPDVTLGFKDWTPELKRSQQGPTQNDDDSELRLFSSIDLILARSSCLVSDKSAPSWVENCFRQLKNFSYFPEDYRTRFVLLKFEDDGVSKIKLLHPYIDDLIYLPLDRPLFLQKIDILLGLPGSVTPKFLFNQKASMEIEISKLSQTESLSESGLRISNPVPLVHGLAAHFYLTLPNTTEPLSLYGKVSHSQPHPDQPNQYLIEFQFFGLKQTDLMSLRRFLKTQENYRNLIQEDPEQFRFNPDNIFLEEKDRRTKQVVVLEVKDAQRQQAADAFTQDMDNIDVLTSSSYYLFLKRHLEEYEPDAEISATNESDLFAPEISFLLQTTENTISQLHPDPEPEDMILGHSAKLIFSSFDSLKSLMKDSLTETLFRESLDVALQGQSLEKMLLLSDVEGKLKSLKVNLKGTAHSDQIEVKISLPSAEESTTKKIKKKLESLDLLVINQAFLPQDVAAWYEGFQQAAKAKGLIAPHKNIPVIVTGTESTPRPLEDYLMAPVDRLIYLNNESRVLMTAAAELLEHEFTRYRKSNIFWQPIRLPVHIAKKTWLEQMSEFGASIRQPRPLQPGTILYLRGSIFENAPNQNLCARFYRTEDHPSESGQYLCHLLYYGINDSFLKFARSWFRETYTASKQKDT